MTTEEASPSDLIAKATEEKEGALDEKKQTEKTKHAATSSEARTDQNEAFSVRIKPQFVLSDRHSSLPPLPVAKVENCNKEDDRDNRQNKGRNKKRGQNKKRPRDAKTADFDKLCLTVIRGEECPYGDKCRYLHDMKVALANRPPDISQVGECPRYSVTGYCPHGVMCRLGSSHINSSTGENLRDESKEQPPPVMNVLSKDTQIQLRRKKFPFKCKRHSEKKDNQVDVVDYSPLPTKRKLIDFSNKVYVAPLTTVGNLPFRRIMKRFGADITCGEMAVASNLLEGKSGEWALLKRHPEEDVFGVQIASGFPDQFTRVCEVLEAHTTVDFVDLNLGCPLDIICNKGAGSALMLRDRKLKTCLQGITKTLSCPITLKMRTGWADDKPVAHQLVSKVQGWGISDSCAAIMVHGRSRLQRYSKLADWDYISKVATHQSPEYPKIPIIGNGDIFTYPDYEEKVAREGLSSTAMLARGALIKPWLPTEIKERRHWDISASERMDMLKDFVRFGLEHWGSDQQGVNNTRRFLLEWLSFLYRYIPVGMLEVVPQLMNHRPPNHMCGRSDLETLMLSKQASDWIKISEMLLGPVPEGFQFEPKHKASG